MRVLQVPEYRVFSPDRENEGRRGREVFKPLTLFSSIFQNFPFPCNIPATQETRRFRVHLHHIHPHLHHPPHTSLIHSYSRFHSKYIHISLNNPLHQHPAKFLFPINLQVLTVITFPKSHNLRLLRIVVE